MKTKLLVATLLAGSSLFAETRFSVGIGVGGHGYAAPPVVTYRPHSLGPGYTWVDGYWDHAGPRRFWREGYWARPSYGRSYSIAPRYDGNRDDRNGYGNDNRQNGYNGGGYDRNGFDASPSYRTSPSGKSNNPGMPAAGNQPNGNIPNGSPSGYTGNRGGNFSKENGNSPNSNFSDGTSRNGSYGSGMNGNRFNNANGHR